MTAYGCPPSGTVPFDDEPWCCDWCSGLMPLGQPYWGGDFNGYTSEANDVHCEKCEIANEADAELAQQEWEREMAALCSKCGTPNFAHMNLPDAPCELAPSYPR